VSQRGREAGLSLVELLVAIVVGLVVVAGVLVIYLSAARNFAQDQRYIQMLENARYAVQVVAADLLLADFWGPVTSPDTIVSALAADAGGCAEAVGLFDTAGTVQVSSESVAHFAPCAAVTDVQVEGTDVLAVKRVAGASGATTGVRLRSSGVGGTLLDSGTANAAIGEKDWAYQARIYFVRRYASTEDDGVPTLCRMEVDGTEFGEPVRLADGIEDLHLQFGIDDDGDGAPNRYLAAPTKAEMAGAVAARIFVLARSADPDPQHTDAKGYQLGDEFREPTGDGYYRRVLTTTVALRNASHRIAMNSE
jgi:type IV pilus assembly protein PilW